MGSFLSPFGCVPRYSRYALSSHTPRREERREERYAIAFPFSLHSSLIRRDRVAPLRGSCLRRVVSEKRTEGEATIRTAGTEAGRVQPNQGAVKG